MTTISKQTECITFINIFTTEPENQSKVVELLTHVTEKFVNKATSAFLYDICGEEKSHARRNPYH